jgi:hypothetical protein
MLDQEANVTIFSHKMIFYFITICFRKTQYVLDRLLTFFSQDAQSFREHVKDT